MKIELVKHTGPLYEALQQFILKRGLLFNAPEWVNVYPSANLKQCVILNKNNEVIGCFVYYTYKKSLFKFVISPPYAPNIDLYYVNPAESIVGINTFNKELSEAVSTYFDSLQADYLNVNLPASIVDTQPFTWKGFVSRTRFTYLINLNVSEELLWNNLASEKRKSINKAVKDELVIQPTRDFKTVYSLLIKSLSRSNKAKNTGIIHKILFEFANENNSYAYIAQLKGIAIGASFCVIHKYKALYLFGGFDSENSHHGAGVSCLWQSILNAKHRGLQYFDFEGSMNPNIERYFREFGGELTAYNCIERVKPGIKLIMNLKGGLPA